MSAHQKRFIILSACVLFGILFISSTTRNDLSNVHEKAENPDDPNLIPDSLENNQDTSEEVSHRPCVYPWLACGVNDVTSQCRIRVDIAKRRDSCRDAGFVQDKAYPLTGLAAYPGSGSLYFRSMMELATGV
jgi:hypothetical protein